MAASANASASASAAAVQGRFLECCSMTRPNFERRLEQAIVWVSQAQALLDVLQVLIPTVPALLEELSGQVHFLKRDRTVLMRDCANLRTAYSRLQNHFDCGETVEWNNGASKTSELVVDPRESIVQDSRLLPSEPEQVSLLPLESGHTETASEEISAGHSADAAGPTTAQGCDALVTDLVPNDSGAGDALDVDVAAKALGLGDHSLTSCTGTPSPKARSPSPSCGSQEKVQVPAPVSEDLVLATPAEEDDEAIPLDNEAEQEAFRMAHEVDKASTITGSPTTSRARILSKQTPEPSNRRQRPRAMWFQAMEGRERVAALGAGAEASSSSASFPSRQPQTHRGRANEATETMNLIQNATKKAQQTQPQSVNEADEARSPASAPKRSKSLLRTLPEALERQRMRITLGEEQEKEKLQLEEISRQTAAAAAAAAAAPSSRQGGSGDRGPGSEGSRTATGWNLREAQPDIPRGPAASGAVSFLPEPKQRPKLPSPSAQDAEFRSRPRGTPEQRSKAAAEGVVGFPQVPRLPKELAGPSQVALSSTAQDPDEAPLILAVEANNLDEVRRLLQEGANPDVTNSKGETSLHRAAELGLVNMVAVLLIGSANPNASVGLMTPSDLAKDHVTETLLVVGGADVEDGPSTEARQEALDALDCRIREEFIEKRLSRVKPNQQEPSAAGPTEEATRPQPSAASVQTPPATAEQAPSLDLSMGQNTPLKEKHPLAPAAVTPGVPAAVTVTPAAVPAAAESRVGANIKPVKESGDLESDEGESGDVAESHRGPWLVDGLEFSADFDSGNCAAVTLSPSSTEGDRCFDVSIRPDSHGAVDEQENPCQWFYFRVRGTLVVNQKLRFQVHGLSRFRNLDAETVAEKCMVDGMRMVVNAAPRRARPQLRDWELVESPTTVTTTSDGSLCLNFHHTVQHKEAHEDCDLYFAFTFPYPLFDIGRDLRDFQKRLTNQSAYVHREHLTQSLGGRSVDLFAFTGPEYQLGGLLPPLNLKGQDTSRNRRPNVIQDRRVIFISARVHPGETPASYILQGLLDFLNSSSREAEQLLRRYVFHVIPVLNPDGVQLGHHRLDTLGVNLNRVYDEPNEMHPTILAAKAACTAAHEHQNGLRLYLDLHAHSTTRGVFLLGDAPKGVGQELSRLYGYALAKRCPSYEYMQSNFIESKRGTGKTEATRETGVPLCFTVESHYSRGHHATSTFRPPDWKRVGAACLEALWDLDCLENLGPLPPGLTRDRAAELDAARRWLLADSNAISKRDKPQPRKPHTPSRITPWFYQVKAPPDHALINRCVEVIENLPVENSGPARCRAHEDFGGLVLLEANLQRQDRLMGQFRYKALQEVIVCKGEYINDEELRRIPKGTEIIVEERTVVAQRLRLRLADGGWVSEYEKHAFDPRLGGRPLLMRMPPELLPAVPKRKLTHYQQRRRAREEQAKAAPEAAGSSAASSRLGPRPRVEASPSRVSATRTATAADSAEVSSSSSRPGPVPGPVTAAATMTPATTTPATTVLPAASAAPSPAVSFFNELTKADHCRPEGKGRDSRGDRQASITRYPIIADSVIQKSQRGASNAPPSLPRPPSTSRPTRSSLPNPLDRPAAAEASTKSPNQQPLES